MGLLPPRSEGARTGIRKIAGHPCRHVRNMRNALCNNCVTRPDGNDY